MHAFWIRFEHLDESSNLNLGAGVTARSEKDARALVEQAFPDALVLSMTVVEDVSSLDQGHVMPNMGNIFARGIWFPKGFEEVAGIVR